MTLLLRAAPQTLRGAETLARGRQGMTSPSFRGFVHHTTPGKIFQFYYRSSIDKSIRLW